VNVPGIKFTKDRHPSYSLIRELFEDRRAPALPGIAFFNGFLDDSPAIYVSLEGLESSAIRGRLRNIFEHVNHAYKDHPETFADSLGVSLELQKIPYMKSSNLSFREWLAKSWNFIRESKAEIMSQLIGFATSKGGAEKK
jgi:hypothetical protein